MLAYPGGGGPSGGDPKCRPPVWTGEGAGDPAAGQAGGLCAFVRRPAEDAAGRTEKTPGGADHSMWPHHLEPIEKERQLWAIFFGNSGAAASSWRCSPSCWFYLFRYQPDSCFLVYTQESLSTCIQMFKKERTHCIFHKKFCCQYSY